MGGSQFIPDLYYDIFYIPTHFYLGGHGKLHQGSLSHFLTRAAVNSGGLIAEVVTGAGAYS